MYQVKKEVYYTLFFLRRAWARAQRRRRWELHFCTVRLQRAHEQRTELIGAGVKQDWLHDLLLPITMISLCLMTWIVDKKVVFRAPQSFGKAWCVKARSTRFSLGERYSNIPSEASGSTGIMHRTEGGANTKVHQTPLLLKKISRSKSGMAWTTIVSIECPSYRVTVSINLTQMESISVVTQLRCLIAKGGTVYWESSRSSNIILPILSIINFVCSYPVTLAVPVVRWLIPYVQDTAAAEQCIERS